MANLDFINKQAEKLTEKKTIDLSMINGPILEYGIDKKTMENFKRNQKEILKQTGQTIKNKKINNQEDIYKAILTDPDNLEKNNKIIIDQAKALIKSLTEEITIEEIEERIGEKVGILKEKTLFTFYSSIMNEFNELLGDNNTPS